MKAYIKPCCKAVVIEPSAFVAASRAVEFSTGVFHTEYKDDLIDDIDGGSFNGFLSADTCGACGGWTENAQYLFAVAGGDE